MFTEGHITVKRTIKEWGWYHNPKVFTLFAHMMIDANYADTDWEGRTIQRGQLVTSLSLLAADTGLSVQEVRTCLKKLIGSGEVRSELVGRMSVITLCNYDCYQNNQQGSNTESTRSQQDISKESNKGKKKENNISDDVVERIYSLYPATCTRVDGRKSSLRTSRKDKEKIARLLSSGDYTEESLSYTIRRYLSEVKPEYIKQLQTFLNNIPDYSDDNTVFSTTDDDVPDDVKAGWTNGRRPQKV